MQGALFGARAIAQGLGPLAFSALFSYFSQPAHYLPSAPLIGLTGLMAVGAVIAATLPASHEPTAHSTDTHLGRRSSDGGPTKAQFGDGERLPLMSGSAGGQEASSSCSPVGREHHTALPAHALHGRTESGRGSRGGIVPAGPAQRDSPASLTAQFSAPEALQVAERISSLPLGALSYRGASLELPRRPV